MSTATLTPGPSNPGAGEGLKPHRALACVLCQKRKIKCDRSFPCANCTKHQTQCVPVTHARQRRRRFPERELLDRLREYENLLRQNHVKFMPLHKGVAVEDKETLEGSYDSDHEYPGAGTGVWSSPSTFTKTESVYEVKNLWQAMNQGAVKPVDEVIVRKAWSEMVNNSNHILFGVQKTSVELSTFHPEPVHIFRHWQTYLDNVNPLLKVTHTPSLQARIVDAAGNVANISPSLEALMFSIYSISTLSLSGPDCESIFSLSKEELATKYQFGCQQALLNCGFLRANDLDTLAALYIYLASVHIISDPQSLSSLLGVAMRIAQRIGIHNDSASISCTVLESEMRRRLWWSLMLFDTRIGELADYKPTLLSPIWDCRIPLNVNDSDLRAEMKQQPMTQSMVATDAIFAIVRCELGEFVRHSSFHLDFTNPALKPIAKDLPEGGDIAAMEKRIEEDYLKLCDPNNPLHFLTIWMSRGFLAKCRLMDHHSRYLSSPTRLTRAQHDNAITYAFTMLECDTKIMSSPLTQRYLWFFQFQFPFPAYIFLIQAMRAQPISTRSANIWEAMSDNYEARSFSRKKVVNSVFRAFTTIVFQAWDVLKEAASKRSEDLSPPRIVASMKQTLDEIAQKSEDAKETGAEQPVGDINTIMRDLFMPLPMGLSNNSMAYDIGGLDGNAGPDPRVFSNMPGQPPFSNDINQLNWDTMNWGFR